VKTLLDTNPLVSALLKPIGHSGQIFHRWRKGEFELAVSPSTLTELTDVLHRPHIIKKYPINEEDITNHVTVLRDFAQVATGNLTVSAIPEDPKDNHVLAAAVETNCIYIVSGDRHLLNLGEYQGIKILTPRAFLELLEAASKSSEGSN
jgi:hypothetical protein